LSVKSTYDCGISSDSEYSNESPLSKSRLGAHLLYLVSYFLSTTLPSSNVYVLAVNPDVSLIDFPAFRSSKCDCLKAWVPI